VSFAGTVSFYPRAQMLAMLLYGVMGAKTSTTTGTAVNEIQSLTLTGAPTALAVTLNYNGTPVTLASTTPTLTTAAAIQTALESLVGVGNVTVTGTNIGAGALTVTFGGSLAATDIAALTTTGTTFTGGTAPALTAATTTPGTPLIGTHAITPGNTNPWFTVEERWGTSLETFIYTDAKINGFKLDVSAEGYLMGEADVIALSAVSGATATTTPQTDLTPLFVGSSIDVKFNGTSLKAKKFTLDYQNNIETNDFRLGSVYMFDAVEKRRSLTMTVDIRPEDSNLWKTAMWGSSAATTAAPGAAATGAIQITCTSFETIGNVVSGGTPYGFTLTIPSAVLKPFKITPSGDDVIGATLEIQATRPNVALPLITATVTNNLATVS
jgi:hypothetical protein